MTQSQLNRAVASATGERVKSIQQRGFSVLPQRRRKRRNPLRSNPVSMKGGYAANGDSQVEPR